MIRRLLVLSTLALTSACTSVKVDRLGNTKLPKVPASEVQQVSVAQAERKPNTKVATIDMRTQSPFAADLNALARKRTGKLGGHAYIVTGGNTYTTVSGGFFSLFGDKTSATMTVDALRWQEAAPAPAVTTGAAAEPPAEPTKRKKRWFLF